MDTNSIIVGFIGLGYAGFPMAALFSKKYKVIGFDISVKRIEELKAGYDRCGDVGSDEIEPMLARGSVLTNRLEDLRECNFLIVSVPTPVNADNKPDLCFVEAATQEIATVLKKGDVVVYSSTVYPGATEEICVPMLEECSGLRYNKDFFVGYVPERINPGDRVHTLATTVSIISGSTESTTKLIAEVYANVLGKEFTYPVSSIKVAESAKVVENAQRDVNIAFINEIAKFLSAMNIDTHEVVDAMNTKWNALGFRPGFVGGHCIGIDPYYISYKARMEGTETPIIDISREINNQMPKYASDKIVSTLKELNSGATDGSDVLLLGFTFKENCPDVRNTKIYDLYNSLIKSAVSVDIYDPYADHATSKELYGLDVINSEKAIKNKKYDAIVLCVAHNAFKDFKINEYLKPNGFVYDFKGFLPRDAEKDICIKRL